MKLNALNRRLCYFLLFSIPLFVLIISYQTDNIKTLLQFRGETYLFNMRLMYQPAKYFLWGILSVLMLTIILFQKERFKLSTPHYLLLIFWLWCLSSFLWSINRYETLESFTHWSLILASIFLISQLLTKQAHFKRAFWVCLLSLSIAIIISIVEQYSTIIAFYTDFGFRNGSTFANYKFMTHFGAALMPLFVPLFFWSRSLREKLALSAMLLLFIIHILIIGYNSKVLWLCLGFDLLFLLFYFIRHVRHFRKLLCASVSIIILCMTYVGIHSYKSISPENASSSMQQRWIIWENTLSAIKDSPMLGTGLGTFPVAYYNYEDAEDRKIYPSDNGWSFFTRQAHNDVLQIFQELGLIGFLLFILFLLTIIISTYKHIYTKDSWRDRHLPISLLLAFLNFLISALVYFPLHQPMGALLFSVVTGVLMSHLWRYEQHSETNFLLLRKPAVSFGIILLTFFLSVTSFRYFLSDWHWQKTYYDSGRGTHHETHIQKALFWDNHDWEKLWSAGRYYYKRQQFHKAKDILRKAMLLNPNVPKIASNLGLTYTNLKEYPRALSYFDKALALGPDYTLAYHNKGLVYFDQLKFKKALAFFKRAQKSYHRHLDVSYYMAALAKANLKEIWPAKMELLEAISIRPTNYRYHKILSQMDKVIERDMRPMHKKETAEDVQLLSEQSFHLLGHTSQNVRMKAQQTLLSLPNSALEPFLEKFHTISDPEVQWRLFYIFSEKMPRKAVDEAKRMLLTGVKRPAMLSILMIRHLSKYSPFDLNDSNLTPVFRKDYTKFVHLYAQK